MRVVFLGSGSSGNATLVASGERGVIVDSGFSAREVLRRVAAAGEAATRIEAILVTHEHSDHLSGVRVLARRLDVPVLATAGTLRAAATCLHDVPAAEPILPGQPLSVAGFSVTAFPTMHDAAEPVGYVFKDARGRRIGIATDTGVVTESIAEALDGCSAIGIEANHDLRMLMEGPYPYFLKRRIASERGHLSNDDAARTLRALAWSGLAHVFGLHLSEQNNTPDTARQTLDASWGSGAVRTIGRAGIAGCEI